MQSMKKRLTEGQFHEAVKGLKVGEQTLEIARSVLGKPELAGDQRIIYVLNLTEPTGLFEARDFQIRDGDTLYVTEAPFVQWQKTLGAITGSTNAATNLANTANAGN